MQSGRDYTKIALSEDDGSCRDINFVAPDPLRLLDFLENLLPQFGVVRGRTCVGDEFSGAGPNGAYGYYQSTGNVRLVLGEGRGLISDLQVFLFREKDGSLFIELTFFPEAIQGDRSVERFVDLVARWKSILRAEKVYSRYECAFWDLEHGDTDDVFWVG